jgi:hypothetical protein
VEVAGNHLNMEKLKTGSAGLVFQLPLKVLLMSTALIATLLASPIAAFSIAPLRSVHHAGQARSVGLTPRSRSSRLRMQQQNVETEEERLRAELDALYPTQKRASVGKMGNRASPSRLVDREADLAKAEEAARIAVADSVAKARASQDPRLSLAAAELAKAEEAARAAVAASIAQGTRRVSATQPAISSNRISEKDLQVPDSREKEPDTVEASEGTAAKQTADEASEALEVYSGSTSPLSPLCCQLPRSARLLHNCARGGRGGGGRCPQYVDRVHGTAVMAGGHQCRCSRGAPCGARWPRDCHSPGYQDRSSCNIRAGAQGWRRSEGTSALS